MDRKRHEVQGLRWWLGIRDGGCSTSSDMECQVDIYCDNGSQMEVKTIRVQALWQHVLLEAAAYCGHQYDKSHAEANHAANPTLNLLDSHS